jgi:mannose-6-phosphate isomerase-like protein (cupin superfamily)
MRVSRRQLCSLLPWAFLPARAIAEGEKLSSFAFKFEDLPVKKRADFESRPIARGKTSTGEQVELHETVLQPNSAPHPAHHHAHSEFWLVREGTLELTINGKKFQLGPGSAAFVAGHEEHGIRNIGKSPASYFVIAVGPTA